jgi:transposase
MACLTKKRKKGHDYYYVTKSGRVDGKPRVIYQKYIGTVEDVITRLCEDTPKREPDEAVCFDFGGPAALLAIAESFDVRGIIDRIIPKRDQGPSVGDYILLAAINRVLAPSSKNQIGEWYDTTVLKRLWGFDKEAFSSQNFWNHMDVIGEEEIHAIEEELCKRAVERFKLDWSSLLYDTTNFFTFINSTNDRCTLAQRGHSKAKRKDLRQVGLSLIVTRGSQIPLLHEVYQGNVNDTTQFRSSCVELADRYKSVVTETSKRDLTVVFDKGNNSEENLTLAMINDVRFVCSLKPSQNAELLAVPLSQYEELKDARWPGLRTYRTKADALGNEQTVVITFSETFYSEQLHSWANQLAKAHKKLDSLGKELSKDNSRRSKESIDKAVGEIINRQPMRDAIKYEIIPNGDKFSLFYRTDQDVFEEYVRRRGGKTILATDQHHWTTSDIIASYHGQSEIEEVFRVMHGNDYMDWQPMFHWTDSKIRVHGLYCVLGFFLLAVLRQELTQAGLRLGFNAILNELTSMQELELTYHTGAPGRPATSIIYNRLNPLQQKISEIITLSQFIRSSN